MTSARELSLEETQKENNRKALEAIKQAGDLSSIPTDGLLKGPGLDSIGVPHANNQNANEAKAETGASIDAEEDEEESGFDRDFLLKQSFKLFSQANNAAQPNQNSQAQLSTPPKHTRSRSI